MEQEEEAVVGLVDLRLELKCKTILFNHPLLFSSYLIALFILHPLSFLFYMFCGILAQQVMIKRLKETICLHTCTQETSLVSSSCLG